MTDNEIIKALECCRKPVGQACKECPLNSKGVDCLDFDIDELVLDLINRQKANAEGLTNAVRVLNEQLSSAKAEAVKEFAERFFKTLRKKGLKGYMFNFYFYYADDVEDSIKKVTKEMVGEG